MNKAVMTLVALLLVPVPAVSQEAPRPGDRDPAQTERRSDRDTRGERSNDQSELGFREQVAGALETVESACSADMRAFCDMVTPGEGRLTLCMRAHEDQISRGCRTALYRVSRGLGRAAERIADVCWNEVRALCGDAERIAQCVVLKKASLSPSCETIVTILGPKVLGQKAQELLARVGMPVFGSGNQSLGQIAEVIRGTDGKVQSIQVDIGRFLGLGTKVVTISAEKIEQATGIKVQLTDTEIRSLPEAKKQ
jgi:PRC-barrel domain protein